jgi:dTDP-glucose pyrophosphorylase
MIEISRHLLNEDDTVASALKLLNSLGKELTLFILDSSEKLVGVVTDGDIRRALVKGVQLTDPVKLVMFTEFKYLKWDKYSLSNLRKYREENVKILPIVDVNFKIIRLIKFDVIYSVLPIDVIIMAGGVGERLRPLTLETPKPMLLIGGKPILEHNIDRLRMFGINNIFISVRYLSHKIETYFGDGKEKGLRINYIREEKPLGTIGSVKLVQNYQNDVILIINSDVLTNIDYEDMYKTFIESGADLAVASIGYSVNIPYAIIDIDTNNEVRSLREKPTYTYYANAGIYMINRKYFELIPENEHFNATDLIDSMIRNKAKVVSYKLIGYWLDIGRHEDFQKAQEDIKHLKFW